jgi:hypothetical protein
MWASSGGPPQGRAGNPPGNMTCKSSGCHNSFDLNSGDGSFSINDAPAHYAPGETYPITVTLSDPGQKRWGFQLTVLDGNNRQAGTVVVTDNTDTQLSDNAGSNPDFIMQRSAGTFAGTNTGPVSWSFNWTAPSQAGGDVTFYAAGNAANNNGSTSGDYVFTTTITSSPSLCEKGDVLEDGTINVLDVLTVVNHILDIVPLSEDGLCRADCNADDTINVLDVLGIVNVILGISECTP